MRKVLLAIVIAVLFIILALTFNIYYLGSNNTINKTIEGNSTIANYSIETSNIINNSNTTQSLPSKEQIESSINWSKYPDIGYHYITDMEISEPTSVINHSFLLVVIRIEIKNPDNVEEIYKQMSGIIKEERNLLGPNSDPELRGEVDGIVAFRAGMLPYSSVIYRRDYYHPVNDLTRSDIDVSEVD